MRDFKLKLIETNNEIGDEDFIFKLDEKATTLDLKVAFTEREGYTADELRLKYKRQEGDDEPLEDDDRLEDIEMHPGIFLLECPSLGPGGIGDGIMSIFCNFSGMQEGEEICLLIGSTKKFEYFKLTLEKNNCSIPNCELLTLLLISGSFPNDIFRCSESSLDPKQTCCC